MKIRAPRTSRALLDVILSVMAMMVLLVGMKAEGDMVPRVDYVLEVVWPEKIDVDLDTWVMRPDGVRMSYQNKDTGHVSIDRDDLGIRNDPAPLNLEVTSFRVPMDGVYYVSVHNYKTTGEFKPEWEVTIVLRRINAIAGRSQIVYSKTFRMPSPRTEQPVFMFEFKDGEIVYKRESNRYITVFGSGP